MVKSAERRIAKYTAKLDGDVAKNRYDATKALSVEQQNVYFPLAEALELAVKTAIDGTPAIELPYYLIFGKQVQKALNNHATATAQLEIDNLHAIWQDRTLDSATLDTVEATVKAL